MNEKTNMELFKAIMNYYIHNDYNFMINREGVYSTIINDNDVVFKLNNIISNNCVIEIAILSKKDEICEMQSIDILNQSFIQIINEINKILKIALLK